MSERPIHFKIRKITEHILKLQAKIDRLKIEREALKLQSRETYR